MRRAKLARGETNVVIEGRERDVVWREQRLVVELDGWGVHGTRRAFEDDRARDARLVAAGWRVLRFTWRQITREPEVVVARLAAALATRP